MHFYTFLLQAHLFCFVSKDIWPDFVPFFIAILKWDQFVYVENIAITLNHYHCVFLQNIKINLLFIKLMQFFCKPSLIVTCYIGLHYNIDSFKRFFYDDSLKLCTINLFKTDFCQLNLNPIIAWPYRKANSYCLVRYVAMRCKHQSIIAYSNQWFSNTQTKDIKTNVFFCLRSCKNILLSNQLLSMFLR